MLRPGSNAKVDLPAVLEDLAHRGVNEAGHKLNGSLIRKGLVDEHLVYLAPRLIGLGCEMAAFGPLEQLAQTVALCFRELSLVGTCGSWLARASAEASPTPLVRRDHCSGTPLSNTTSMRSFDLTKRPRNIPG